MRRGISTAQAILLFCVLLAFLESGCASHRSAARSPAPQNLYIVTADSTPFYRHSPRQGSGPDKDIPRDTSMTLIRRSSGFCKVQLADGEKGFVASDNIRPAAGTLVASNADTHTEKPVASSGEWRAALPEPRVSAPEPSLPVSEPTPIALPASLGH
jgi:hypothetical protein